jgi:3-hydroxyacyl-CoA dehydrogenase/enoyl-CoA hydratase/3-hydroxybutyryl-CoA epimerase
MSPDEIQKRLMAVMIAEAKRCLEENVVASEDDVDVGMVFGTGFPPFRGGLVKWARDAGLW